jgi:thiamine pyrophosphokinase
VIATNVLGGRTDHALGALGALAHAVYRWGMQLVLRDESELCFFVSCGDKEKVLELEYRDEALASITFTEAGQPCSVSPPYAPHARPLHVSLISWGGSSLVSIKGTEWELSHHTLSPDSSLGVSNILRSQSLRLTVHSGEGTVLLLLTF